MILNKFLAIGLLSTVAVGSALASNPIMKVNQSSGIHTDIISIPSGKTVDVGMKFGLGHNNNGSCVISKTVTEPGTLKFKNGDTLSIEGAGLKRVEGAGFTCMTETLTDTDNGTASTNSFKLISDAAGNYIGSNPSVSHVTLN